MSLRHLQDDGWFDASSAGVRAALVPIVTKIRDYQSQTAIRFSATDGVSAQAHLDARETLLRLAMREDVARLLLDAGTDVHARVKQLQNA